MIRSNLTQSWLRATTATSLLALMAAFAGSRDASAQTTLYGIGGADTGNGPNASAYSLFTFNSATPGTATTIGTVATTTGYALESIAFQPGTNTLYGFQYNGSTNQGQLVTINRTTAALTTLGSAFAIGSISGNSGNSATISFNPTNGAIRLVTGTYGNYRINASTGALIAQDASVAYAPGDPNANNTFQIGSLAYNSNNPTTLYDVDYVTGNLATQNITAGTMAPSGQLTTVGPLGIVPTQGAPSTGFTIAAGNLAFLNSTDSTQGGAVQDRLYSVSLTTGAAAPLGLIGASATFNTVDIAAFVVPEPGTYALCLVGLGAVAFGVRRRRVMA